MHPLLHRQLLLLVAEAVLFAALPAQAQLTIAYPNSTDVTIQDAVGRAGCGGTVLLAAGTYTGAQVSTVPDSSDRLLLSCGSRLIGAGIDKTVLAVLAAPNSPSPPFGLHPFVGLGADAGELHPFTSDFELAHLTVTTSPPVSALKSTGQAVAIGWATNVHIHDLRISGFDVAIQADLTNNAEVDHVTVEGRDISGTQGILFNEAGLFTSSLTPNGHMTGNSIHSNYVSRVGTGISMMNNDAASVHHNTVVKSRTGAQFRGVGDLDLHHNLLGKNTMRGLNIFNSIGGSYHHNTYCENAVGIRYGPSAVPGSFGYGPSSENTFHHETLLGNYVQDIAYDDTNLGSGNTISPVPTNLPGVCPAP